MFICRRTGNVHNPFILPHTSLFLLPLIFYFLGDLGYILKISPRNTSPTSSSMSNGLCGRQGGNVVSPCRRTWNSLTFVPTCCNRYRARYWADRIETGFLVPALLPWAILLSLIPHWQSQGLAWKISEITPGPGNASE